MPLQIILCMETNRTSRTDYIYIKDTIDRFYIYDNRVKFTPIFMGSKSKYKSNDVKRQIKGYKNDFTIGKTHVIYCIDTDSLEMDMVHANEFKNVKLYCEDNNYDLVWFCHDIEEVYLGKSVTKSEKLDMAKHFHVKKKIMDVSDNVLSFDSIKKSSSNILVVLDKYLSRKV